MTNTTATVLTYEESKPIRRAAGKQAISFPSEDVGIADMICELRFVPGFNELENRTMQSHGQHGMEIEFALVGPRGAVSVSLATNWSPIGPATPKRGEGEDAFYTDICHVGGYGGRGSLMPPMGRSVVVHWRDPIDGYTEEDGVNPCDYVGTCYSTQSYLAADPIMADFISFGHAKLYERLKDWYDSVATTQDGAAL